MQENEVLKEVTKELNWRERIVVKVFKKTINKIYDITRIIIVNKLIK